METSLLHTHTRQAEQRWVSQVTAVQVSTFSARYRLVAPPSYQPAKPCYVLRLVAPRGPLGVPSWASRALRVDLRHIMEKPF